MEQNRFSGVIPALTSAIAAVAFFLAIAACGKAQGEAHSAEGQASAVGSTVPDLQLGPLNGGAAVRLNDLRGKVVLLDVWASWCAPCKEELPMLDDMVGRLRSKGIEIVAVSIDDNKEDAETFLRSRPSWSLLLAHDPEGQVPGKLQPPKMPSSYIIDREGVIRELNAGFARSDAEKIEARLVELAGAPADDHAPKSSPAATASAPPAEPPATAAAPRPVLTSNGSIDGKPFAPKLARVLGRMQKDGRVLLSLTERADCAKPSDFEPGDAALTLLVPWKDGFTAKLASLKRSAKSAPVTFTRLNRAKKSELSKTFKPSGTVTIVSAPIEQGAVGKMKIDLSNADYRLEGDLDVRLCVSPK